MDSYVFKEEEERTQYIVPDHAAEEDRMRDECIRQVYTGTLHYETHIP